MSSTSAPPPPPLPYSGFFGDNYEVSDAPPLPDAVASSSSTTGISNSAVIIVIVFSITVIVSISLCFLIRILRGRSTSRLHTDEQLGRSGGGGSSRVMASRRVQPIDDQHILPIFSYEYANRTGARVGGGEKSKSASGGGGGGDCPICLSKFEPKDNLRLLPICCHAFHAECVDLWLESNQSCPLCRSPIVASEAEILQKVLTASSAAPTLRPDPVTLRPVINQPTHVSVQPVSLVRAESNKTDIGGNGSWLRDYMETLSSRTASFRSSARYFSGSSGRSEMTLPVEGYWDLEASRAGEEISEMFRWFSGI